MKTNLRNLIAAALLACPVFAAPAIAGWGRIIDRSLVPSTARRVPVPVATFYTPAQPTVLPAANTSFYAAPTMAYRPAVSPYAVAPAATPYAAVPYSPAPYPTVPAANFPIAPPPVAPYQPVAPSIFYGPAVGTR